MNSWSQYPPTPAKPLKNSGNTGTGWTKTKAEEETRELTEEELIIQTKIYDASDAL